MPSDWLFTYGTLRKTNHGLPSRLAAHCTYLAEGYLQGRLYEIQGYPGAIPSTEPNDRVYGDVYKLQHSDALFQQLDNYEECAAHFPAPHEYIRQVYPITLINGQPLQAWVYLFNHPVTSLRQIPSGDYSPHLKR